MGTKARIALLVLFLFGVPAVVTTALLSSNAKELTADGAQPGGVLQGDVHDVDGKPLATVELEVFSVPSEGTRTRLAEAKSDERGAFTLSIPPIQGHYELRVAGEHVQELRHDVSWLDASGKIVAPAPLKLVMLPAASLDIEFVRVGGAPAGSGTFELSGTESGGFFSGFNARRMQTNGSFAAGKLSLRGLPPMQAHLAARLESGERVELVLRLVAGPNAHRVEL